MKKIFTILIGVIISLFILVAGVYLFSRVHFNPIYNGKVSISKINKNTHVFFDDYGIPHILAESRSDLYNTFGYTVMQDRYFQIQLQKMIGSGRLSEWFGNKTLETDKIIRTIGIKHYTSLWFQRNKNKINPELLSDLYSWLNGVNECIKKCPKPIELVLLRATPEPLTIEDVLAFSGIMSFSFSKAYYTDALVTKLSKSINDSQLQELVGSALGERQKKVTLNNQPFNKTTLNLKSIASADPLNFLSGLDGSQSWVISPEKSASGFATLANDPHIAFSNPDVWYEAHLKSENFELYGYFVPIIPFALIGHNKDKAWSLTMSTTDEVDLLTDADPTHFTDRKEVILVKNETSVELNIKDTKFGPVINNLLKDNQNAILSWHYFRDDNFTVETFYDLSHASKLNQFYAALRKARAPGLNVSWADKDGNIAWKILGYFPKRTSPFWKVHAVTQADFDSINNMNQAVDDKDIPQLENPKSGYILSANQKPPVNYDENKISGYWEPSERFNSLKKDLDSVKKIDHEFQKKMFQDNNFFGSAERLNKMLSQVKTNDAEVKKILESWDGQASIDNKAQGFYYLWIDNLMKLVLNKKLSEVEQEQFCSTSNYWKLATKIIDNPKSDWWNNQYKESLQLSFDQTLDYFKKTYITINNWSWGKIHQVVFEHPLGKIKPLNYFFNLGPYPVSGGYMVPNAYRHKLCSNNFNVTGGASTRRLIDFKDPTESFGVLPTGNSGVPFSKHYSDQVELFLKGDLRSQTLNWDKIKNFTDHVEFEIDSIN